VAKAGCPGPLEKLGNQLEASGIQSLFNKLGFYETPNLRTNQTSATTPASITNPAVAAIGQKDILVSPLQLALAAAVFNNEGNRPNPELLFAAKDYQGEWINYSDSDPGFQIFSASSARQIAEMLAHPSLPIWETTAVAVTDLDSQLTWYLAGTLPDQEQKLTVVVLLERFEPEFAARIGQSLIMATREMSD
jgi:membrane peptidoglycan carboxypeptidase